MSEDELAGGSPTRLIEVRLNEYMALENDAECYRVLRTIGVCDGIIHLRITDEMDAAINEALARSHERKR